MTDSVRAANSCSTSLRSPEPVPVSALTGNDQGRKLLSKVLDYYEGRKPFDFHRLPDDQRGNDALDAWQEIAEEIRIYLQESA